jgi:integrase
MRTLPVPEKGQRTYFDDGLANFGCRISQGGTRSFIVQLGADRQLVTIGRYPIISLAEARGQARRLIAERTLGKFRPHSISWNEAVDLYLGVCEQKNKPRTLRDYRRLLKRHFPFHHKRLSEITTQDINHRIDRLRNTVSEQNHTVATIKIFFRWALRRHYVDRSPCEGLQIIKRPPRRRVLSDRELAAVYQTAATIRYPFGSIVQLCILTGQRRSEIAWLCRSYMTRDTVTFPPSLTKNNREHIFPISATARAIINNSPILNDLVFAGARGTHVFSNWAKQKTAFDAALAEHGHVVKPWTLHDLRRTFASGLAALDIRIEVIEKLLNHVSGCFSGVTGIYQRHSYMEEMRVAVALWEKHVASLLKSDQSTVLITAEIETAPRLVHSP